VNKEKGETELKVGEETYTLKLDINAICEIESVLKMSIGAALDRIMNDPTEVTICRAILFGALSANHPEVDIKKTGEILNIIGLNDAVNLAKESVYIAFPTKKKTGKGGARKKQKTPGSGKNS